LALEAGAPDAGAGSAAAVREVRAAFARYEQALIAHDIETLNGMFLDSPQSIRFGLAEQNYGIEAIAAYRRASLPVHRERRLLRTVISGYGADVVWVSAEFTDPVTAGLGRQTQTWVRTAAGWKIAVAHVSVSQAAR
jgi:ketosteroid isomerase-like protein